ncbi:MAG: peptide ABC transporter substrate-binding protein [Tumebacillaceae bacterium]
MKKVLLAPLLLSSLVAAVGCGGNNSTSDATPNSNTTKQQVNVAFLSEPTALDESKATAEEAFTMINAFGEGLYRLDKDGKPQPAMAAELPQISPDGKTYTIKLRDNATWSDGTPVTAHDFEYSWKRTLDPATKSEYAFMLVNWIKGAGDYNTGKVKTADNVGVKALDDKTLKVELTGPVAFFTSQLAFQVFFPEKQAFVEKYGDKFGSDADKVLSNGPFVLKTWNHEQNLEFVKNDKYWDAKNVKLDKINFQIVENQNTSMNLYETNDVDVAEINRDQVIQWKSKPDYLAVPSLFSYSLRFNETKVPAFKNAKIRKALTWAVDRQAFVDTVLGNGSVPSKGDIPAGTADGNNEEFRKVAGDTEPNFDVAQAKQLLADGLKELGMQKLPLIHMITDDDETSKKSIEFIQGQLKQNLGVETDVQTIPKKLRLDKATKKDYEMIAPSRWGADYNDPMTFLDLWMTNGDMNTVGYSNPAYDALVAKAKAEPDPKKRSDEMVQAEKILMDDMPIGPMYYLGRSYLKRTNIQDMIFPRFGSQYEFRWAFVSGK